MSQETAAPATETSPAPETAGTALQPARRKKPVKTIDADAGQTKRKSIRRFILPLLILGGIGYGGTMGYEWFVSGRYIITTDDAYVGANMAIISAKISGHAAEIAVVNNQVVHAGDLLVRIDDGDYRLAIEAARNKIASQDATIARIARQAEAQVSVIAQGKAQLDGAKAQLQGSEAEQLRAAQEFDRSQKMAQTNYGSQQRLEQASADKARTTAALANTTAVAAAAQAAVDTATANLDVLQAQKVEAEHVRAELVTTLDKAERDLTFTRITAPFDGVVGNKAIELGQLAQPGTRLMALIAPSTAYVDANFKETQLGMIRPGQKVEIAVDSLGGKMIEGTVTSIAPATGSQFSLLPPDNATGNFTKVVQRVPVRIALTPNAANAMALRPGLSVTASVHTRDESLPAPTLLGALGMSVGTAKEKATR